MVDSVKINRAPVMTLWAAVVAERLGYDADAALTLGKAVSGLNAQSKGQRLGIYDGESGDEEKDRQSARDRQPDEQYTVGLLGRAVPVVDTKNGVRAISKGRPDDPESVRRYLKNKFGEALPQVTEEMRALAGHFSEDELKRRAYSLYEEFRPEVPEGTRGWGAKGILDLEKLRKLREAG